MKRLQFNFNGGIISPEVIARADTEKRQAGVADALNMRVLAHGPLTKRSGMRYIAPVGNEARRVRLIPFSYNADQTAIIELGHYYIRLYSAGGSVLSYESEDVVFADGKFSYFLYYSGTPVYFDPLEQVYVSHSSGGFFATISVVEDVDPTPDGNTVLLTLVHADGSAVLLPDSTGIVINRLINLVSPYSEDQIFDVHYVQSADVLTLVHPAYPVHELRRFAADNWSLSQPLFKPIIEPPVGATMSVVQAPTPDEFQTAQYYQVTALTSGGIEESVASDVASADLVELSVSDAVYYPESYSGLAGGGVRKYTKITTATAHNLQSGDLVAIADMEGMTALNGKSYSVQATFGANTFSVLENTESSPAYTTGGTVTSGSLNNLSQQGAYNTIKWAAVAGADRYNVFKKQGGIFGYIGQTTDLVFKDNNVTPDMSKTPPTSVNPFLGAGNYPSAVCYFEQRRVFAATDNAPQTVWMTKPATESNMSSSLPTNDGDAISFTLGAREQNRIRHLVPIDDLMAMTVGCEFRIYPAGGDIVAPATINARAQTYTGSSQVQPVTTNGTVLYVQAQGERVHELGYSGDSGTRVYRSNDLCRVAHHLFDDHTIVDMAYSAGSMGTLWVVRDDGQLMGLTYVPEEKVVAWHRHVTDGAVESVACVFEGGKPSVYAVVRRTIGDMQRRYIERMNDWRPASLADSFFVDCGLSYSGEPRDVLTGLWHLEGRTVSILADGAVHPARTVVDGAVALEVAASVVHVGLPFESLIKTLPLMIDGAPALGQGVFKKITDAYLNVTRSSGFAVGAQLTKLYEFKQRTVEVYGSPPAWYDGQAKVEVLGSWDSVDHVYIQSKDPLPLTLLSITVEVSTGG